MALMVLQCHAESTLPLEIRVQIYLLTVDILFNFAANGAWKMFSAVTDPDQSVGYAKRGDDAFNPKVQATGYHQFTFNQADP